MYTLIIPGHSFEVATLAGVFNLFSDERVQATDTSLIGLHGVARDVRVVRYNGKLGIRHEGNAADIVAAMFDELRMLWRDPDGTMREPWEILPADWQLLFSLFDLARMPERFLSSDQLDAEKAEARDAGRFFDVSALFDALASERFGFDRYGPRTPTGHVDSRHQLHVAYAMLLNRPVPEPVLAAYRAMEAPFRHIEWAVPLLDVPTLRGRLSGPKLRGLASVMRMEKLAITEQNVDALVTCVDRLPDDPGYVDVDDALFAAGLLPAMPLPDVYDSPSAVGQPVSPLAARLRQLNADDHREKSLKQADSERAGRRISARRHAQQCAMARLAHGRESFDWANRVAASIERRDVANLLKVFDTADDWNVRSKQVLFEFHGVKLRGMKSMSRRRAIFDFCGLDEAAQTAWEADDAARKDAMRKAEDAQHAKEMAQSTRYRRDDGTLIDGATHVEQAIAAGFRELRDWRKGASRQYALVNPDLNEARRLRAKDGTLAYARAMLERIAA
ncbi:hypothetical protein [Paraburkholderia rhizosphaerae]|uniref:Uncharacterized protein n=1 Tax=Paraburkholderia rhizosphaerae TaxID=480658 RepID=A0A4R8LS17_9BURK|nr:hypothetical protein [Paraburkholderia rhizosphaerae]TDY48315.1 hypothetical protein BX592_111250 [Paraburkholderia rhizosphaerae]